MDSQNNDSKNPQKCETSSQIMIMSKPSKNCDKIQLRNNDIDSEPLRESPSSDRHQIGPFLLGSPTPNWQLELQSEERQVYQERIPPRMNSTPNLPSTTRTSSSSFHSSILLPMIRTPESAVEMKHDDDNWNNLPTRMASEEQEKVRSRSLNQPVNNCPLPEVPENSGISGLLFRLNSLISSRPLDSFDEEVLNNFNLKVGTAASRIDMWRQRLEDEKTNSVRSHSRSADIGSSPRFTPSRQAHSFISGEIQHLIQLTRNLTNSLFGSFGSGLLGIEDRLIDLLEKSSHVVFPVAEILITNIWRMLRLILDMHKDDTEKRGGVYSVAEAINNAFSAIISLIHLGKAYRNAHESSDSEYTTEDSRSLVTGSLANLDMKDS